MARVLNQADIDNIINLKLTTDMTMAQIADAVGSSSSVVHRLLVSKGITGKTYFTDAQKLAILDAFNSGIGIGGLTEKLGFSCPARAAKNLLKSFGVAPRNRSEQQSARMANSTTEQIAALTKSAHAAVRGSKRSIESQMLRAKTMEGKINKRSHWEAFVFSFLNERFDNVTPAKAAGIYNIDIAVGSVAVEIFGGGWSITDKGRIDKYLKRTKEIAELGFSTIFVVFLQKDAGCFDGENLVAQINQASLDPASARKYRVVWGDFNAASGLCSDINHDAFVPPFVNVRDVTTGRYKRVLR